MAKKKTKKEIALETEVQAQAEVQVEEGAKEILNETVEQEVIEAPKSVWDKAVERFNSWGSKK
jgi:hypothetical protein